MGSNSCIRPAAICASEASWSAFRAPNPLCAALRWVAREPPASGKGSELATVEGACCEHAAVVTVAHMRRRESTQKRLDVRHVALRDPERGRTRVRDRRGWHCSQVAGQGSSLDFPFALHRDAQYPLVTLRTVDRRDVCRLEPPVEGKWE